MNGAPRCFHHVSVQSAQKVQFTDVDGVVALATEESGDPRAVRPARTLWLRIRRSHARAAISGSELREGPGGWSGRRSDGAASISSPAASSGAVVATRKRRMLSTARPEASSHHSSSGPGVSYELAGPG